MKKIHKKITFLYIVICIIFLTSCNQSFKNTIKKESSDTTMSKKTSTITNDNTTKEINSTITNDNTTKEKNLNNSYKISIPSNKSEVKDPTSITVLVNKRYYLPSNYIPNDLTIPNVKFSFSGNHEKKNLRVEAAKALEELFIAAKKENLTLYAVSGYRSYSRQNSIYANNLQTKGEEYTIKYSAKPGQSEHQTGLAMDVSCQSINFLLSESFADTAEGQWLKANAHNYGFIIRYTNDKKSITEYNYEPWHIRYVGKKLATYLTQNNLTLDEYYYLKNMIP